MKKYLFFVGLLFPYVLFSQSIKGIVTDVNNQPLFGANVFWANSNSGTIADGDGEFELKMIATSPNLLVASYVGHTSDTLEITNQNHVVFKLKESHALNEVVLRTKQEGVVISNLNPIKTEHITQAELGKAACCDLAGCFETQSSVQPQTTNVITNSKELRILGLSGVYNQVLVDGFPMIQGLN